MLFGGELLIADEQHATLEPAWRRPPHRHRARRAGLDRAAGSDRALERIAAAESEAWRAVSALIYGQLDAAVHMLAQTLEPAMGSILLARKTPPSGGDTLFASLAAAYDSLSDGLKATLDGLRAVHSADHIYGHDGVYSKTDQASDLKGHDIHTHAVHPAVIRHPVTARKILYVNPAFTLHFEGWSRDESLPLLNHLYTVAMRDEFHCRLEWRPGSIAIWDNRSTWHYAMNDYHGHARVMHRITISGEALH